ncbi:2-hydroxymuconic semialdehyde dehydrogenase [Pseudomonas taiwanensis]|uniref:2-hydroxymuconic semialdehyde dehydrogenase n=1 Tax=Pseudomonas TaxID=286 RepID=UPI0015B99B15|nr:MULTISPECIES: 2-hydroxymuconic semialdehyde dehydrogenase [Pseudomonas]MDH4564391.1 2-hydroxymuconic semialdehyde dehydrogenase [Pseudomonas sp. BN411]MDH4653753.1 2-hydroxymuconic semialdehyde dehydrogenase [Pseudomonas sp. BN606]MDH4874089.1 2-hydroxymuconic semialdehyde dehydrogenase [Pseudomonas sp. BN515]NWL75721.1 2-hydroxymuconic semialdehyde dehydrogenase [Pseudomonas taiwanensis]
MRNIDNFIAGEFVAAASGKRFDKRSPVDNRVIASISEAGRAEVDSAVKSARSALHGEWGGLTTEQRVDMLHAVANEITRRFDDFVEAEMADTGQPAHVMRHAFIPRGAANFKVFADVIKNVASESFRMDTPDGRGALNYSMRVPKGVIGVICPWNAPFLLMTWKVGPALACGNTVLVKPSEESPLTATLLGEVMNTVGIPKGVYNVLHGFGPDSAGEFITQHPGIDAITFTGETRTGTAIMKAAAEGMRDVSFELGGKNAGIVFADADFDAAVDGIFRSSFLNSGQVCLGTERVYVERPIFERFVQALKVKAEGVKYGRPEDHATTYGPLISQEHRSKVLSYYRKAVEEGATVVTGGGVPDMPGELAEGSWVQPTIWTGLPDNAAVVREEIFGPCCHIRPFDSENEVVSLANDNEYGLSTTIWTSDLSRAHRMAARIDVGITWINSWFLRDLRTAFGGSKQSGIGREGGVHSLEFYTETRNVCVKL